MRDEIYAVAIVWVFKDGTETFAYHIPGRKKDYYSDGITPAPETGDPNNPVDQGMTLSALGYPEHNRPPADGVGWDSSVIVSGGAYEISQNMNVHHQDYHTEVVIGCIPPPAVTNLPGGTGDCDFMSCGIKAMHYCQ